MEAQFCLAAPQRNSTAQRTVHVQSVPLPSSGLRPPGHLAVAGRHPEVPLRPWHRQVGCSTPALPNRSLSPHKMPSFTPGHLEPPLRLSLRLHGGSATSGCLRRPACGLDSARSSWFQTPWRPERSVGCWVPLPSAQVHVLSHQRSASVFQASGFILSSVPHPHVMMPYKIGDALQLRHLCLS